jgi:hypothetical protein
MSKAFSANYIEQTCFRSFSSNKNAILDAANKEQPEVAESNNGADYSILNTDDQKHLHFARATGCPDKFRVLKRERGGTPDVYDERGEKTYISLWKGVAE